MGQQRSIKNTNHGKIPGIPSDVKVIECQSIDLTAKDIITVKKLDDFLWLLAHGVTYKLKKTLYILSDEVAYIYIAEEEKP